MITRKQYETALEIISEYRNQIKREYEEIRYEISFTHTSDTKLENTHMSVKLYNILRSNARKFNLNVDYFDKNSSTIADLKNISMSEFLTVRLCGKKTLEELKNICIHAGVIMKP